MIRQPFGGRCLEREILTWHYVFITINCRERRHIRQIKRERKIVVTLYKKIILFIVLLIFPLNLIAISVTRKAVDTTVDQMEMADHQLASTHMKELGIRMRAAISMLYYFSTDDTDCIQMMRQQSGEDYVKAKLQFFVKLQNWAYLADGADGYFYYLKKTNDELYYGTEGIPKPDSAVLCETVESIPLQRWSICTIDGMTCLVLVQDRKDTLYGCWINLDSISQNIISGMEYQSTDVSFTQSKMKMGKDRVGASFTEHGVTLTVSQDRREVLYNLAFESTLLYIVAIVYLAAVPVLCGYIYRFLLRPLKAVSKAASEIRQGDLEYRIKEKSSSPEYSEVFHAFNKMLDELKTNKIDYYQKEAERRKLELYNLRLQIRPHFLVNVISLIYTLAQRQETDAVQEALLYLSDYFRYMFRGNNETEPFKQEEEVIRGYGKIANYRYRNRLALCFDITPEIDKVRIPPLLLHNFVENTVKHGICQGKVLHVQIRGRYKEGIVIFEIQDDGIGMDSQTLEHTREIFSGKPDLSYGNEHIGLRYCYRRLTAVFGETASITVQSEQDVGTCFTICFPYEIGGDDDEPSDCK